MGFTGSTPNGSGTISDIFPVQEEGKAMAVWAMGPCIGPLAGGYMVEAIRWRWTGFIATLCYFAAPETYAPTLLRTKAAKLKKETGNSDLYSILDKDGLTPKQRLSNDSIRPMRMLFTHLPVFILSLSTSPSSTACCTSCSAPSPLYLRSSMGLVLAPSVWRISLQVLECCLVVIKKKVEQNGKKVPEDRLPIWMTLPSGLLIVGALLSYGWAADQNTHWIVPMIGVALSCFSLMGIMMCLQTYLDAYVTYAASAVAAMTVLRSLAGAMLPLTGLSMYDDLGLGWENSIIAFLALALVPVPVIFFLQGFKIRAKSPNNLG
ncbi:hypothetical protein FOVG_18354 [Fusarium oxysporum f. sp. pisi HDV247]|uniref:Major facilitator superfamily (MFS) profile domain-containing protein n=1 Tax=Fusarium oxysporum f. sp. pisi HDV247 TaxID=1080344 RepID=W9NC48_FUSOX|nr:hypothetical protein FOVG_18354 [Fusarium oxysporum f. sp. pisi HDV247]